MTACTSAGVGRPGLETVFTSADGGCLAVGLTPDGETVAIGRRDGVDVYAGAPLTVRNELRFNDAHISSTDVPVLSAGLSPDGRRLVAGDDITRVGLFDIATGVRTRLDSAGKGIGVRWSPDGSAFAVIVLTRQVVIHDGSGEPVNHLVHEESGTNYFVGGAWTTDASRLVVGTEDGRILAWSFADSPD